MSPLYTRIQTEITQALKKGDRVRLDTLRLIVSQAKYKQIEIQRELTDEDIIGIIRKQLKEMAESNEQYAAAKRQDLVDANLAQIAIMQEYMPAEISDEQLHKLITDFIAANQAAYAANPRTLTGKVVAALRAQAAPDRISKMYGGMIKTN